MLTLPALETERLLIRPFTLADLEDAHRLLDVELAEANLGSEKMASLAERAEWLQWSVLNEVQLAKLYQPPYGDRAVVLKASGKLIGTCGYVPLLMPFEQIPGFYSAAPPGPGQDSVELGLHTAELGLYTAEVGLYTAEVGLFYAISPAHQRRGYASEAAAALLDAAFQQLHLRRVVATTQSDNAGSIGVMRRLGMRILVNPRPDPSWLQVVGVLLRQPRSPFINEEFGSETRHS